MRSLKTNRRLAAALASNRDGIAAVEFAALLPVITLLFFGMLEASDLFTVNRRLANATNSLVDLIAKEPSITEAELDDLIIGVTRIIEPSDTSTVTMKVISVTRASSASDPVLVHWSRDEDGEEPYPDGAVYTNLNDDESLKPGQSLLVAEIGYQYNSGLTGRVFQLPFNFNHQSARWPRKSTKVQLCATSDESTCTS